MQVTILYCEMCGGRGHADSVAIELKQKLGLEAELKDVGRGRFDILVNGKTIYAKSVMGAFPEPKDVIKLFRRTFKQKGG